MAELAALSALVSQAAPAIALGSTALGAVGMVQESRAQDAAAEANARQLEMKRKADLAQASVNAEQRRKQADQFLSKQRAIAAASGAGTGGSAAGLMADTAAKGEFSSALDMWLGTEQATGDQYAADVARMEARARRRALPFNVGATVLSGVSKAAYGRSPMVSPFQTTTESYYG